MAIAYHVTIRLRDDRVIATSTSARRLVARIVLHQGVRAGLLAFAASDTHIHFVVACSERDAHQMARRIELALHHRLSLAVSFEAARVRAILSQGHLYNAVRYLFRQQEHHETSSDPFHDATSLPDLLGLRVTGQYTIEAVRERLPRLKRGELLELLSRHDLTSQPMALEQLGEAAAAALCLGDLAGRGRDVVLARAGAVRVYREHATARAIGEALGVKEQAVRRLHGRSVPSSVVRAVELQLRLRSVRRGDPWAAQG